MHYDIIFVWINVHGGSFHKLLHLQDVLNEHGLKSLVLLNSDEPLGLQAGLDFQPSHVDGLARRHVRICGIDAIRTVVEETPAKLVMFDAHQTPHVEEFANIAKERHGARTGQLASLLGDFSYHSTDFIFIQNLLALWFLMDYRKGRRRACGKLAALKKVYLAGNVFFEPVVNTWTSDVDSRESLFEKYGLDPARPLCVWLPDRNDGLDESFRKVVDIANESGMNTLVKLHPWEYKQYVHGYDTFGTGETASQRWGVLPLAEQDSSWAYRYCDLAIYRGSAVGLELPFWERPGVCIWPEEDYRTMLSRGSATRIPGIEALKDALSAHRTRNVSSRDYALARRRIATIWEQDSFTQLVECIKDALATPEEYPTIGSPSKLRRLFLGRIPWRMLKGEHMIDHGLARMTGSLFSQKDKPPYLYTKVYPDFTQE